MTNPAIANNIPKTKYFLFSRFPSANNNIPAAVNKEAFFVNSISK